MSGRSEGDGVGGNIISSGYHAVLLARLSCCWTAVFLLFAFPPFLSTIKTFLPLFFHFIILLLPPSSKKEIYNFCPDLFTRFSSPCSTHSSLFSSSRFVSSPLLPIFSPLASSLVYFLVLPASRLFRYHIQTVSDIHHSNSTDYFEIKKYLLNLILN